MKKVYSKIEIIGIVGLICIGIFYVLTRSFGYPRAEMRILTSTMTLILYLVLAFVKKINENKNK